jgi:hypothetical protein
LRISLGHEAVRLRISNADDASHKQKAKSLLLILSALPAFGSHVDHRGLTRLGLECVHHEILARLIQAGQLLHTHFHGLEGSEDCVSVVPIGE